LVDEHELAALVFNAGMGPGGDDVIHHDVVLGVSPQGYHRVALVHVDVRIPGLQTEPAEEDLQGDVPGERHGLVVLVPHDLVDGELAALSLDGGPGEAFHAHLALGRQHVDGLLGW
jgi:hypothetical protein